MKKFGIFIASGEFEASIKGRLYPADIPVGGAGIEGVYDDSFYYDFDTESATLKQSLSLTPDKSSIAADGVDATTIPVPAGVTVSLNGGEPVEVTDGEVVFKTLDAGDHVLTFSGIKYLPQEVTIGAV